MKHIYFILLILLLPFLPAFTFHTIQVDGELKDWVTDEKLASENVKSGANISFFLTWDEENLYLAAENLSQEDDLFINIDTDPQLPGKFGDGTDAETPNSPKAYQLPFYTDYTFVIKSDNTTNLWRFAENVSHKLEENRVNTLSAIREKCWQPFQNFTGKVEKKAKDKSLQCEISIPWDNIGHIGIKPFATKGRRPLEFNFLLFVYNSKENKIKAACPQLPKDENNNFEKYLSFSVKENVKPATDNNPEALRQPLPPPESRGSITIKWSTKSERQVKGYYLYRSENEAGPFKLVSPEMLPAHWETSEDEVYQYQIIDDQICKDKTYYYYLESLQGDGITDKYFNVIKNVDASSEKKPEEDKKEFIETTLEPIEESPEK